MILCKCNTLKTGADNDEKIQHPNMQNFHLKSLFQASRPASNFVKHYSLRRDGKAKTEKTNFSFISTVVSCRRDSRELKRRKTFKLSRANKYFAKQKENKLVSDEKKNRKEYKRKKLKMLKNGFSLFLSVVDDPIRVDELIFTLLLFVNGQWWWWWCLKMRLIHSWNELSWACKSCA